MGAHYIYYSKPAQVELDLSIHDADGIPLDHWSSAQFKKLRGGDHIWIVTIAEGRLLLIGHLAVDRVITFQQAVKYLGRDDIYDATYHAVCEPDKAENMEVLDIHDSAPALRFESANDRLVFADDGLLAAQQMQSMRRLADESIALLEDTWYGDADDIDAGANAEAEIAEGGGYEMDSAMRQLIEQAAVAHVTDALTKEGWVVKSVEAERCGYDLLCTQGDQERHVEVKGTRGDQPTFFITAQELRYADDDNAFELWVIVRSLQDEPNAYRYTGRELRKKFLLQPVQYRAVLKAAAGEDEEGG